MIGKHVPLWNWRYSGMDAAIEVKKNTHTKNEGERMCFGRVASSCFTIVTSRVTVKQHEHRLIRKSCWTQVYVNKYNQQKYNMNSLQNK